MVFSKITNAIICAQLLEYNLYNNNILIALFAEVEALQVELLVTLLNNTDGTAKQPASRTIFLSKFKRFINENLISNRVSTQCVSKYGDSLRANRSRDTEEISQQSCRYVTNSADTLADHIMLLSSTSGCIQNFMGH